MKTEKVGLAGSAAVIGLIYGVALAAAAEAGLSAQTDPTQTTRTALLESQAASVVAGVAAPRLDSSEASEPDAPLAQPRSPKATRACPHTLGEQMSFAEPMQAHHHPPSRRSATPGATSPPWGKAKLTVF